MIKINRKFISLLNYFIDNKPFSFDKNFSKNQILGAIQPLVSMLHDVQYTFKPYRSFLDFLYDTLQPIRGIINFTAGAISILGALIFFSYQALSYPFSVNQQESYTIHLKHKFLISLSWLINGLSLGLRGLTQFFTTPLTWFFKIPLRASITEYFGAPKIEENEEVKHLLKLASEQYDNGDIELETTIHDLHKTFLDNLDIGQETNIKRDLENEKYSSIIIENELNHLIAESYITFFQSSMNTPDANLPRPMQTLSSV